MEVARNENIAFNNFKDCEKIFPVAKSRGIPFRKTRQLENKIENFNQNLARILAAVAYHISPAIVNYIVKKNQQEVAFFAKLFEGKIAVEDYLFAGSACVFPGVRRFIATIGAKNKYSREYQAIIDDNAFPRQIWCYLVSGRNYSTKIWKTARLCEFELAHIWAHKESELKYEQDFFFSMAENLRPHGEFTSAANVVLLPKGIVRPTDTNPVMKAIFYQRYIDLYGEKLLNGRNGFRRDLIPDWYGELEWNAPFLPDNWRLKIDELLKWRNKRIADILEKSAPPPADQ